MIVGAAGAEERHTSNSRAVGMWAGPSGLTIETTYKNTGAAGFKGVGGATGMTGLSPVSSNQSKGWWSFAFTGTFFGNGSYVCLFDLCNDTGSDIRQIGWIAGTSNNIKLALFKSAVVKASSTTQIVFGAAPTAHMPVQIEFDAGEWTVYWKPVGGAWESFNWTDDVITSMPEMRMHIDDTTDESKGSANAIPYFDDCIFWNSEGDDWNSKPGDFGSDAGVPRISVAHYPDGTTDKTEDDGGDPEWQEIDEAVPDHSQVDQTEADYWATLEDIDDGTKGYEDYTGVTIQAVMVTDVAGPDPTYPTFNAEYSGTLYEDTGQGGGDADPPLIQEGNDAAAGTKWWTLAQYWPWTPAATKENWAQGTGSTNCVNDWNFGPGIINGETDQMTMQIIYFGSAAEWEPPAAGAGFAYSQAILV